MDFDRQRHDRDASGAAESGGVLAVGVADGGGRAFVSIGGTSSFCLVSIYFAFSVDSGDRGGFFGAKKSAFHFFHSNRHCLRVQNIEDVGEP